MIEIPRTSIPELDTEQMIEVDRAMMEDYRIELMQMMENAGRNLAHLARERYFGSNPVTRSVLVMAGSGGNGGGALVAARRLANWGAEVEVALTKLPDKIAGIPAHQLDILQRMGISNTREIARVKQLSRENYDLIIDGLIGYSLKGAPNGLSAELIDYANGSAIPVLSLDTPSGVDTTSGTIHQPAIKADATMTLALPKQGLFAEGVPKYTGDLYLADISVPPELYASKALGIQVSALFAQSDIVKIV